MKDFIIFCVGVALTAFVIIQSNSEVDLYGSPYPYDYTSPRIISDEEARQAFMDFIVTHQKEYKDAEQFYLKFKVFKDNYQMIYDHNAMDLEHKLEVNRFADMTPQEFKDTLLNTKHDSLFDRASKIVNGEYITYPDTDLPDTVDWSQVEGALPAIKDQGACGSCWAFSTIGAIEYAHWKATGESVRFSEQQLVDCAKDHEAYPNNGCHGGFPHWAFVYAERHNICTEEEYPYNAKAAMCEDSKCNQDVRVKDFSLVKPLDHLELMKATVEGPVSVTVCASTWQFYKSGVHKFMCGTCADHAVILVGYGTDEKKGDYWKIRNSWGEKWGEQGYIRVGRKAVDKEDPDYCGVDNAPYVPITN